ncbi:MAG: FecR family protein [Planctomycetes bacterium]|nr:FecR family protein [Planctomycetota bacterium]
MSERHGNLNEHGAPLGELDLLRYIEGRLEPEQQQAMEARLKGDADARRTLDALREEDRLLRAGLENLSEPPVRIAEKVLATLFAEHRRSQNVIRARIRRRRFLYAMAAAAMLLMTVWIARPRDRAGFLANGTGCSVARGNGDPRPLNPGEDANVYEGDRLIASRGQFVRVQFNDGSVVDLDEDSELLVEKGGRSPMLVLQAGRAAFQAGPQVIGLLIKTDGGSVSLEEPGAQVDLWMAQPTASRWPDWAAAWALPDPAPAKPKHATICMTVLAGKATIFYVAGGGGVEYSTPARVTYGPDLSPQPNQDVQALYALEPRTENWAQAGAHGPQDRPCLGLTEDPDWPELARRMELTTVEFGKGGTATIDEANAAVTLLADAAKTIEPAARAAKLGQGQSALRNLGEGTLHADERRWRIRVLEALAHYERGRALLATGTEQDRSDAQSAFLAAVVAFREAREGGMKDLAVEKAKGLDAYGFTAPAANARMNAYHPNQQALMIACFYQPWALYNLKDLAGSAVTVTPSDPEPLFEEASKFFGRSVESLGASYGLGLALRQKGKREEAADVLTGLSATSIAGLSDPVRLWVQGIKQAAHAVRLQMSVDACDEFGVSKVLDEFKVRYPLDTNTRGGREVRRVRDAMQRDRAQQALNEGRYADALDAFSVILTGAQELSADERWHVQLGKLEAAVGARRVPVALVAANELQRLAEPADLDEAARTKAARLVEEAKVLREKQKNGEDLGEPEPKAAPAPAEEKSPALPGSIKLDLSQ